MQIQSVLSHLGAWRKIQMDYPSFINEFNNGLAALSSHVPAPSVPESQDIFFQLSAALVTQGWNAKPDSFQFGPSRHRVDLSKENLAVEFIGGNIASALTFIFAKLPILLRTHPHLLPVIVLASCDLHPPLSAGTALFEQVASLVRDLHPLPFMHPFMLIGIGPAPGPCHVEELTSDLDRYLISLHQRTLDDMALELEHPTYDFKAQLPEDTKKTAKEICALANLRGGGSILLGVDDNGQAVGVPHHALDKIQLTIGSIASDRCSPVPEMTFRAFPLTSNPGKSVLIVRVLEIIEKPCMSDDRVFIRYGTSARPAKAEEIRRLLIA
ncbi:MULTISPECIES: helix-turn-helix domain-containing protein [unclassified Massilia]|uniref:AlbA family DNA-binding domain-containing protein n=1 Tax=unclassified Massilia TaxID=2609279 RepID=UPI00177FE890|nr:MULTISPECIES: ATP-binding protein [unclassified Massilia]MBD8531705.1 ATP-binding protein [Massilia sp. CFBP 13647]MBD8675150.1 ATP-binding protein [Massilia sp. CFBP 13721]